MITVLSEKQAAEYRKLKIEREAELARRAQNIRHAIEEKQEREKDTWPDPITQ